MKIIEVRDGFIKFEADKSIYLSSFIQVDGETKSYIAQVNQLKTFGNIAIAGAKILFLYIDGKLQNYDRTEPPKNASIKNFTLDILNNSINAQKPVIIGKTPDDEISIKIDASAFDKKMLISVDDKKMNNILIRNFSKQFENLGENTIILDTLGIIDAKKYKAGKDFKLPLDTSALAFMYEDCLNDATGESKAVIIEIFKELSEYSKTVPFVPFETLKTIVDDMVDKQHVFKLFVLKNKLAKFAAQGYFASSPQEVENLQKILSKKCAIIDFSSMDTLFMNRYLAYVYEKMNDCKDIQVFLETSNAVSKKNLKRIFVNSKLPTALITHSKFQYLNDMKNMFDNFIIEPSIVNNSVFSVYAAFLNSMKKDMYLTAGEAINYIPLVSNLQVIDETVPFSAKEEPVTQTEKNEEENVTEPEEEIITDSEMPEETVEISDSEAPSEETVEPEIVEDEEVSPEELIQDNTPDAAENDLSEEKIIADIDKKSDSVIDSIAQTVQEPVTAELFNDDEEETETEEQPEEIAEEKDVIIEAHTESPQNDEPINPEQEDVAAPLEYASEDTLSELAQEEDLTTDLSEVNTNSQELGEVTDEDLITEDEKIEPLEEISDENQEVPPEDILAEDEDSDSQETLDNLEEQDLTLDENSEDTTIELDDSTEELLESAEEPEEDYPEGRTALDVDLGEPKVMPISGEALNHDFDEIVELDSSEANDDDIVVDLKDDDEQININDATEKEIMADVDKVYTTIKDEDKPEDISDSDLDLIDELNSSGEELEEYHGELEEVSDADNDILEEVHPEENRIKNDDSGEILEHKDSNTPIVPLYDADIPQEDMVMSDPIKQGDAVIHAKYGSGVVEKMIKYGNKTLYAINFENIGRRLLDPTLTEIKKA